MTLPWGTGAWTTAPILTGLHVLRRRRRPQVQGDILDGVRALAQVKPCTCRCQRLDQFVSRGPSVTLSSITTIPKPAIPRMSPFPPPVDGRPDVVYRQFWARAGTANAERHGQLTRSVIND